MKTDTDIFLRTPEHEMLSGKVSATTDKGYNVVFEGWAFSLEDGAEVLVFYEVNRRFMQQPVRVLSGGIARAPRCREPPRWLLSSTRPRQCP